MAYSLIATTDAKGHFIELVNRVAHGKERIILTRRGQEIAALIPVDDLRLLQSNQNQEDLAAAIDSLKEARESGTLLLEEFTTGQTGQAS